MMEEAHIILVMLAAAFLFICAAAKKEQEQKKEEQRKRALDLLLDRLDDPEPLPPATPALRCCPNERCSNHEPQKGNYCRTCGTRLASERERA